MKKIAILGAIIGILLFIGTEVLATTTLDQSQTQYGDWLESAFGGIFGLRWRAQSFTTGNEVTNISQVKFWLSATGSPDDAEVMIYLSDTGANDNKPTGECLGTSDAVSVSDAGEYTFDFSPPVTVSAETKYVAIIHQVAGGGDILNYIRIYGEFDGGYDGGIYLESNNEGDAWTTKTWDAYFKTYWYEETEEEGTTYLIHLALLFGFGSLITLNSITILFNKKME